MIDLSKILRPRRARLNSIMGLALDGSRLDGVVLRRADGGLQVQNSFSVVLSLDPLTNDPELVGREIRNHLDAAEARERHCIVGLPLKWALTAHVEVPQLPEADVASFLRLEAERGFPCDVETLHLATSRCRSAGGKQHALLVGFPKSHLERLERVLRAAKLRPVSFSLGITALQPAEAVGAAGGILALAVGDNQVALQLAVGGGVAALRALEGGLETEGGSRTLRADMVAREARITLGQLPGELRDGIRSIRVFGPREMAQELVDELELRLESMGLKAETVARYAPREFGLPLAAETAVSPALSLAAGLLTGRATPFEFLPPRVSGWQQMMARYSSGRWRTTLVTAGGAGVLLGALFLYQQYQLWSLQKQWAKAEPMVTRLQDVESKIKQYSPWFDEKVRGLAILRGLTQAFPPDGSVTAKTVEIRDLRTVTCTGTARSGRDLLLTIQHLRALPQVREVNQGPTRGQAPAVQFSFNLVWDSRGRNAN
jgi:hypothetical protein